MSLIKFGGGVIGMSGSIAGNTFARNRYGSYVRARTKPTNKRTVDQTTVRNIIKSLASMWFSLLNATNRAAWKLYAESVPMMNRLGESIYLSGFNMFVRSNAVILRGGGTVVETGPTTFELPATDPTLAIAATADDQKVTVTFDATMEWCDEDAGQLQIYVGKPQKASVSFFNGPWKYAGKISGNHTTPPTTGVALDSPFAIAADQVLYAYGRIVRADGRVTNPFRVSGVVSAS